MFSVCNNPVNGDVVANLMSGLTVPALKPAGLLIELIVTWPCWSTNVFDQLTVPDITPLPAGNWIALPGFLILCGLPYPLKLI